jgi:two-component system chemotaxis sensor kinase CheA
MSNPLLELFISEAQELLETAVTSLLKLEKQTDNAELINEAFRSVHTLKSSAAMFDFDAITLIAAASEDLLQRLRARELELSTDMVDELFDQLDCVKTWIPYIESHETLPDNALELAKESAARIRAYLTDSSDATPPPPPATVSINSYLQELIASLSAAQCQQLFTAQSGRALTFFYYQPDSQCFYAGEDPFLLVKQLPQLQALQIKPVAPWSALEDFDTYSCQLVFFGFSSDNFSNVSNYFRPVAEQVQISKISPLWLLTPQGEPPTESPEWLNQAIELVNQESLRELQQLAHNKLAELPESARAASVLRHLLSLLNSAWANSAAARLLLNAINSTQAPDWQAFPVELAPKTPPAIEAAPAIKQTTSTEAQQHAFRHILQEQIKVLEMADNPALRSGTLQAVLTTVSNCLNYMQLSQSLEVVSYAQQQALFEPDNRLFIAALKTILQQPFTAQAVPAPIAEEQPEIATPTPVRNGLVIDKPAESENLAKVLKIDQAKIDRLMDLVGELIVAKNSLPYLAKRADGIFEAREIAKEIKEQYGVINRIADEMQDAIMQVRMLPVSQILKRFPRLVRDLSHALDKQIELVIHGENTEIDKNIIEVLSEPLIHIVRNCIDHGIESVAQRRKLGKPDTGRITINAYQEHDNVILDISDDGQGIDTNAVRQKALKMSIINQERLDAMNDKDIMQLVFAAGLSTSQKISDVSGRGVGMDVVHSVIQRFGGSVSLNSQLGQGTQIQLSLPLTMAVTQVMTIELNGQLFGIPINTVVETMRLPIDKIQTIKHKEAFVLRDRIVPLVRLHQVLELPEQNQVEELAVLVVKVFGEVIGLVIDKFHGGLEVILKPMEGVLNNFRGYSGTALLGDGSVLIVLNLKELL